MLFFWESDRKKELASSLHMKRVGRVLFLPPGIANGIDLEGTNGCK